MNSHDKARSVLVAALDKARAAVLDPAHDRTPSDSAKALGDLAKARAALAVHDAEEING